MRHQFRHRNTLRFFIAVAWLALLDRGSGAQESAEPPAKEAADSAPVPPPQARVAAETLPLEQQPSLLYLPDEEGNLRPVPGFDLEQLIELYKVKNGIEQQSRPPDFSIVEIHIDGTAIHTDGTADGSRQAGSRLPDCDS